MYVTLFQTLQLLKNEAVISEVGKHAYQCIIVMNVYEFID